MNKTNQYMKMSILPILISEFNHMTITIFNYTFSENVVILKLTWIFWEGGVFLVSKKKVSKRNNVWVFILADNRICYKDIVINDRELL